MGSVDRFIFLREGKGWTARSREQVLVMLWLKWRDQKKAQRYKKTKEKEQEDRKNGRKKVS